MASSVAKDRDYSAKQAQRRFEATLRGALKTPAKPHEDMKVGKAKGKKGKSPGALLRKASKKKNARS